ncbi:hypothetical protein GSI_11866 [Ganoderma sinense ZZ0214-1]|uniref:Uncharacterized protein n=1 Tax=Ganoderma sinense ZZ0214-1 TaxID=1077348 RepID=A0A2G8RX82_9APHY|nr:hypothetical protein GSI_11866 [Ganoderma sinense ZZ0214-1]
MAMTMDAYMAGLTCRISKLHLIAWGGTMDAEVEAICAMFADARPSVFRLLAIRPAHIDYLNALFYEGVELFSSMSSLELRVDVAAVPFDFKAYLVARHCRDRASTSPYNLPASGNQVLQVHIATRRLHEPEYCDDALDLEDTANARCYTLSAMAGEDLQVRLQYFLGQVPTLRRVTIAWGRRTRRIPHRYVTIDLENIPHTIDRPGRHTDLYWQDGYANRN